MQGKGSDLTNADSISNVRNCERNQTSEGIQNERFQIKLEKGQIKICGLGFLRLFTSLRQLNNIMKYWIA